MVPLHIAIFEGYEADQLIVIKYLEVFKFLLAQSDMYVNADYIREYNKKI